MKTLFLIQASRVSYIPMIFLFISILGNTFHGYSQVPKPEDFGFNSTPVIGETPLLIILLEFQDERFDPSHTSNYYQDLFFGPTNFAVNASIGGKGGYFYQNSNSKFWYKNEGVLGPFLHPEKGECVRGKTSGCEANVNTLQQVALDYAEQSGFNFNRFDSDGNNNGILEATELTIFVIEAGPKVDGAFRGPYSLKNLKIPGIAHGSQYAGTDIITHELTHSYGTTDVYGTNCNNDNYTLMSCSDFTVNSRYTNHLDPYHKIKLGWSVPVLIPIPSQDLAIDIWASELPGLPRHKVYLIYDPNRGKKEFFLMEHRYNGAIEYGSGYHVPINSWWSSSRGDNFATTNSLWFGYVGDEKSPDYRHYRMEGFAFHPLNPLPPGVNPTQTIPLYSWWSPSRGDNFLTSDPNWSGSAGDIKGPDYEFVRREGYVYSPDIPQPEGTVPVFSWWNPDREDNIFTSNPLWSGEIGDTKDGYTLYRLEGYIPIAPFLNYDNDAWDEGFQSLPDEGIGVWHVLLDPQSFNLRWIPSVNTGTVGQGKLPLNVWYSPDRKEHFTTTHENWQWNTYEVPRNNYRLVSIDGYISPPWKRPSPTEVPLYSWWNPDRGDNFTTTDPAWSGDLGDQKEGYTLFRMEGFVESIYKPGYDTLFSWWNPNRTDNFLTTQWEGNVDGVTGRERVGYSNFRIEGYIEKSPSPNDWGLLIDPPIGQAGLANTSSLWSESDQIGSVNWFDGSFAFAFDVVSPVKNNPIVTVVMGSSIPVSLEKVITESGVNIYPNPVSRHETLKLKYSTSNPGNQLIRIVNLQGQVLKEIRTISTPIKSTKIIELNPDFELNSGIYIVQVVQDGLVRTTKLIVK